MRCSVIRDCGCFGLGIFHFLQSDLQRDCRLAVVEQAAISTSDADAMTCLMILERGEKGGGEGIKWVKL